MLFLLGLTDGHVKLYNEFEHYNPPKSRNGCILRKCVPGLDAYFTQNYGFPYPLLFKLLSSNQNYL